jgi:hypothetical protein
MKSGLQVANCFVGRVYFFLSNVHVRGTNYTGSKNRKEIGRALQKHGISKDHTQGLLKFKLFGRKQQNIANVLDNAHRESVIEYTVYSLFADTPNKRTPPLNGHFLRDRQNMYGFANKIFPLKRTPY